MKLKLPWMLAVAATMAGSAALAEEAQTGALTLPAVLGDNMVLQRGMEVPVWGTARPGEAVAVTFDGKTARAKADADGRWQVKLPSHKAGGPFEMAIVAESGRIDLHNVLVGEVWVCSGQSNMQMGVAGCNKAQDEIANSGNPKIRLFAVGLQVAAEPRSDCKGQWVESNPQTVPGFSATGYFFGRELQRKLGVPVGLINTSWGGTPAESWTDLGFLRSDPDFQAIVDRIPTLPADNPWLPTGLYNAMIAPLVPYGIGGAIWYQGESNADRSYQYRKLFPAMIQCWRKAWGQGDFPFLFVQLANFTARDAQPVESAWAELREAQTMTLALPKTGMAVIIDIGEAADIHPKNKQDVGARLALAAQSVAYGGKLVYSGPMYSGMKVEGNRVRLRFSQVGTGLEARGGKLAGFAVAGEDHKFVWANAEIDGKTVVVWSDAVPQPVAVRYAWANNPECSLYNREGLPASPFRTDDWPGITIKNR